ncbi:hypothetical protein KXV85_002845, partial [Aspergillus fumigatus]
TQMIVGADAASDHTILHTSANLYGSYRLRRVYYSAFSPIPDASRALPLRAPPLLREHRLYQADWLMRFYGFDVGEIVDDSAMLPLDIDPKLAWALRHRDRFPLDVNRASREELLRVPGFGTKTVERIIATRRTTTIRLADLARLGDAAFRALFAKSPVKRIGRDRFVRNVLIAIGNSGDAALAAEAERLLDDASPLVRGAAVWAL